MKNLFPKLGNFLAIAQKAANFRACDWLTDEFTILVLLKMA